MCIFVNMGMRIFVNMGMRIFVMRTQQVHSLIGLYVQKKTGATNVMHQKRLFASLCMAVENGECLNAKQNEKENGECFNVKQRRKENGECFNAKKKGEKEKKGQWKVFSTCQHVETLSIFFFFLATKIINPNPQKNSS